MTNYVEIICGRHMIKFMHDTESKREPTCPFCLHEFEHLDEKARFEHLENKK